MRLVSNSNSPVREIEVNDLDDSHNDSQAKQSHQLRKMVSLETVGLNNGFNLQNSKVALPKKRLYRPQGPGEQDGSCVGGDPLGDTFSLNSSFQMISHEMVGKARETEAAGCKSADHSRQAEFAIVPLDFEEFFDLMLLKIQYQRKSISQSQNSQLRNNLASRSSDSQAQP
mmetsp:Transcript_17735/g.30024  ORF Transcript_17735/g.30024 Transcript_17735/m.30024 type:complete len:171 (-) Transcript_17735:1665-2177(-)